MPTIQDIMDKKKAFKKELSEFGESALKDEFKRIFAKHPELLALKWRQYTPYFNDGEPCYFRVSEFEMKLSTTPADDDGSNSDYGDEGFEVAWSEDPEKKAVLESIHSLQRIDKEIYEIAFGDHCEITATPAGFEVDEYSHD